MTYVGLGGVFVGRPPCALCHAAYRLHAKDGTCPEQYRTQSLDEARRDLLAAIESRDPVREFIARGEVQRLGGTE